MSLRSAIVDGLIANGGINAVIAGRAFDMFYEFEDLLNRKANKYKFPAITVESETWENEQNQDGHDNLINTSLSITIYQQVHLGNMKSRSATVRAALKNTLEGAGYIVNVASDGVDALNMVDGSHFDLLMTDLNMPNMDGLQFISEVRKLSGNRFTPIIILSGDSKDQRRKECISAGASAYLQKPFKQDQVLGILRMIVPN